VVKSERSAEIPASMAENNDIHEREKIAKEIEKTSE